MTKKVRVLESEGTPSPKIERESHTDLMNGSVDTQDDPPEDNDGTRSLTPDSGAETEESNSSAANFAEALSILLSAAMPVMVSPQPGTP